MKLRAIYYAIKMLLHPQYIRLLSPFRKNHGLPDFLIIGAPKSGTTSLFFYLAQHPGIVPPGIKEIGYFSKAKHFKYGETWYRAHFPSPDTMRRQALRLGYQPITGEATPAMILRMYSRNAHSLVPDAKIIMILRNPVDRALSHYHHLQRKPGGKTQSFPDALHAEPERIASGILLNETGDQHPGNDFHEYSYLHKGQYIDQIQMWLECYNREQLLILNFDEFTADPEKICNRTSQFLGLPEHQFSIRKALNKGHYKPGMEPACRDLLTEHFRPYNRRLFDFLGEDWGWPT